MSDTTIPPIQLRTTTLAAAACEYGVRVYTKTAANTIEDVGSDTTNQALAEAIKANNHDMVSYGGIWHDGTLPSVDCDSDTAICTFAAGNWNQSLFFQDPLVRLCEWRHAGGKWARTDFVETNAMIGSNLAVVHDAAANRVILFFQDNDRWICSRTATAKEWSMTGVTWSTDRVRIVQAAAGTGIGVTAWNDLGEIRLYYQAEDNCIYEARGGFGKKWDVPSTALLKYYHPIGDITAVSWTGTGGIELRLYLQNERAQIVEWGYNGVTWYGGDFQFQALPNADIIAFVRPVASKSGFCLYVLWAGEDQMLYQRAYAGDWAKWQDPAKIASIDTVGEYVGSWVNGQQFTDLPLGLDRKRIKRVIIRSGDVIDAIGLVFTDGTKSLVHGGSGGGGFEFPLESGEEIVKIEYSADKNFLQRLRFHTSRGRESDWYGRLGAEVTHIWTRDGTTALAGFIGCTKPFVNGNTVVSGLAPIWSGRRAGGMLRLADDWQREAKTLKDRLASIRTRFDAAVADAATTRERLNALKTPAKAAMESSVQLSESIEYLRDLQAAQAKARLVVTKRRAAALTAQVTVCKVESDDVEAKFKALVDALKLIEPDCIALRSAVVAVLDDFYNASERLKTLKAEMKTQHADRVAYHEQLEKEMKSVEEEIKALKAAIQKLGTEKTDLVTQFSQKKRTFTVTRGPYAKTDARADTTGAKIEDIEEEISNKEQLVVSKNGQIQQEKAGLKAAEAMLSLIEAVANDASTLEEVVRQKEPELTALLAQLTGLQETIIAHANLLGTIAEESKNVDASARAEEFAQKFVPVLDKALSIIYIKGLAKLDELALQVMRDIAGAK